MATTSLIVVPLNETRDTDEQSVGTVITRAGKTYKWVKNASTTTSLKAGGVAIYTAGDTTLKSVVQPDSASAAGIYRAAGVPVVAIAAEEYGWVQTKGLCSATVYQAASSNDKYGVAGIPLVPTTATDAAGAHWYPAVKIYTNDAESLESLAGTVQFTGKVIPVADIASATDAAGTTSVSVYVDCKE
jgi:hypothetical protein